MTVCPIDPGFVSRLQRFSDKHCRGKIARLDLLQDMAEVFCLRVSVRPEQIEEVVVLPVDGKAKPCDN